ncbi:MAG: hypothetical protein HKM28_06990, partial [Flavobacteriaceae bacterium]|nr:hypothetical protein [Flavobacteriaceae bacterium]
MNLPISFGLSKSSQIDALRLAIQSSVSAIMTYVIMSSFQIPEIFLGILSAVLIVSPSIGDTYHQAKQRILSTIIGCLI